MDTTLASFLETHAIPFALYTHPAVFTVAEAQIHCKHVPGLACKNLFLKTDTKPKQYYLATIPDEKRMDLKALAAMLGVKKLTFASAEELLAILGLTPGSVSPMGLVNDTEKKTIFLVDREVWEAPSINVHPNINTESIELEHEALEKLIAALGVHYQII